MKKSIKFVLSCILILSLLTPGSVFALISEDQITSEGSYLTEGINLDLLNMPDNDNIISPMATGLIKSRSISISKNGNQINIKGYTMGFANVVKCGFTKVVLQRRANSSASWSECFTFKSLYSDSNYYLLSETVATNSGYQYRVVCTHYAKKSLFSTEKIDSTSNIITL